MKTLFKQYPLLLILVLSAMIIGCKDEDSPTTPAVKPAAPVVAFHGPDSTSTNQYAIEANQQSAIFNLQGEMFKSFAQLPGTQNGNVWTYTETQDGLTVTVTSEYLSTGMYRWRIVFNGLYDDEDTSGMVTNWTAFEGTTTADGKSGSWKIYVFNSTNVELEMTWATDASGNQTGSIKQYSNNSVTEQLDLVSNANGSGKYTFFTKGSTQLYKALEVVWGTDGKGTYTLYNELGAVIDSGTF